MQEPACIVSVRQDDCRRSMQTWPLHDVMSSEGWTQDLVREDEHLYSSHYQDIITRNSSGDEIANVNFLYDDIVHVLQNTIDSCINSATDRRGYVLELMCLPNSVK